MTCPDPQQFPEWFEYVKVFSTPIAALVAAIIAGLIAYRQWATARNKLKLDLFDKRFAIFTELKRFVSLVVVRGKATDEDIYNFAIGTREASWLLDDEIQKYIDEEVHEKALDLQTLRSELEGVPVGEERNANVRQQAEIKKWFAAQLPYIKTLFDPYLKLKH